MTLSENEPTEIETERQDLEKDEDTEKGKQNMLLKICYQ